MHFDSKELANSLKNLTIEQTAKLLKQLSEDLDINLESLLALSSSESNNEQDDQEKEQVKKKYTVNLVSFDSGKQMDLIRAIKALKPDLSLLESKNQLNSLPLLLKSDLLESEANLLKQEWEKIGGKTELVEEK